MVQKDAYPFSTTRPALKGFSRRKRLGATRRLPLNHHESPFDGGLGLKVTHATIGDKL